MRVRLWFVVMVVIAGACGAGDTVAPPTDPNAPTTTVEPRGPVTTHEVPTTTLVGQPSVGDGPENPMRVGEPMSVGGWNVAVTGREKLDGGTTDGLSDSVQVAVWVTATYGGNPGLGDFFDDLAITALGTGGFSHELVAEGCPNSPPPRDEARVGNVVEGNLCFLVGGEVADLQLVVKARHSARPHTVYLATQ